MSAGHPKDPAAASEAASAETADPSGTLPFETAEQRSAWIRSLPKEVGAMLMIVGVGGVILPGPIGAPFVLIGGVVLWPRAFGSVERSFARRFPKLHRQGARQILRFINDLERRYPAPQNASKPDQPNM